MMISVMTFEHDNDKIMIMMTIPIEVTLVGIATDVSDEH